MPIEKSKQWIKFFETHLSYTTGEVSIHYKKDGSEEQSNNFLSLHLNKNFNNGIVFEQVAQDIYGYIQAMIFNYTGYLKEKISPAITGEYMASTSNIRIMRYQVGNHIKDHLDIGTRNHRASCTLNLHSDYEGGEFTFFSGNYVLNLKQGEGLIFPAEQVWIHGVKPITKGTRYCVNCFLHP
jgi:hypothetical protein